MNALVLLALPWLTVSLNYSTTALVSLTGVNTRAQSCSIYWIQNGVRSTYVIPANSQVNIQLNLVYVLTATVLGGSGLVVANFNGCGVL